MRPILGGGFAYTDGSCDNHIIKELRAAGWAVAFCDANGTRQGTLRGPVWEPLPASAQSAEYTAFAGGAQATEAYTFFIADCMNVIKDVKRFLQEPTPKSSSVHGCYCKELCDSVQILLREHQIRMLPSEG